MGSRWDLVVIRKPGFRKDRKDAVCPPLSSQEPHCDVALPPSGQLLVTALAPPSCPGPALLSLSLCGLGGAACPPPPPRVPGPCLGQSCVMLLGHSHLQRWLDTQPLAERAPGLVPGSLARFLSLLEQERREVGPSCCPPGRPLPLRTWCAELSPRTASASTLCCTFCAFGQMSSDACPP